MTRRLSVVNLGRRRYGEVLELQRATRLARIAGSLSDDILLLVEHEPVYTMGRSTHDTSIPANRDELRARGAEVFEVERGGDVTWHGPGQLVGYPILDLAAHRQDLHWYLRALESALIAALLQLGIPAERDVEHTGVWTRGRKIASIGVHVKQWVTMHGFALNIDPDLSWFEPVVPCGIQGVRMTSLQCEGVTATGSMLHRQVSAAVVAALGHQFDRTPRGMALGELGADLVALLPEVSVEPVVKPLIHLP